jgi:signal transduction histidine kinase
MIAHDMRSSLQAASLSMLAAEEAVDDPEMVRVHLERAQRSIRSLTEMVNSLLEITPDGRSQLEKAEFVPAALILQAVDQVMPLASQKQLRVRVGEVSTLPVRVDGNRVIRVLVNLLTNAIRFSPETEEIEVRAKARSNDGHPAIVFSVSDNGSGIAPEDIDRIFLSGVSLEHENRHSTGLGLTVCKEIVEEHGGRIWVETGHSAGATISFALPLPTEPLACDVGDRSL